MSPSKPATPDEGKPDEAKIEQQAADSKAVPVADEVVGEASSDKPKRARRRIGAAAAKSEASEDTAEEPKTRRTARRAKAAADKPAAPSAKTRRPARDYGDNPPMVRAHAKYVRTSARKARLVCDHIRGKSVEEARAILAHASRDVARDWSKLLESAVANAEHNHELIGDELRIAAVKADEGPTLKRFRPRAMGRATKIRKRTSHLSITLTPMDRER
jgi:ribosomal protein L22